MNLSTIDTILAQRNLTRVDLANHLLTTPASIGRYIRGDREAPYDVLIGICEYLDISLDYLLGVKVSNEVLPEDEKLLLERYRHLNPDGKEIIRSKALELQINYPALSEEAAV